MKRLLKFLGFGRDPLVESVQFFLSLGFFADLSDQGVEETAAYLAGKYAAYWGHGFNTTDRHTDLKLLIFDNNRVWWEDTEADVASGRTVYAQTLREWSSISRGAFQPENITEYWESEEEDIELRFTLGEREALLRPQFLDDYIDLSILLEINRLIANSGISFELYRPFDQTGFIVALTPNEKKQLQRRRSWQLVEWGRTA